MIDVFSLQIILTNREEKGLMPSHFTLRGGGCYILPNDTKLVLSPGICRMALWRIHTRAKMKDHLKKNV